MATRSNIFVKGGPFSIMLYRHWDGYLAETGAHLLETLKRAGLTGDLARRHPDDCAAQYANHLLRCNNGPDRFDYEVTTAIHGDIEHLYAVTFTNGGGFEIGHSKIDRECEDDAAALGATTRYTIREFADLVNRERAQVAARCRSRGIDATVEPVQI